MISNSAKTIKCKEEKTAASSILVCGLRGNVSDTTLMVYYQSLTGNWDAYVKSFDVE